VNAARIATPHNNAKMMSFRVLMVAPQPSGPDPLIYDEPVPDSATKPTKLVVVGQGYVGLPLAMRAVEQGFDVVGFDVDEGKIKRLGAGESTVEDVGDERLRAALATGRYQPTTSADDCADFDVSVISVPTPLRDGNPDLRYIEDAARSIGVHLRAGATVVLESTTYPGTTEELMAPILEDRSGLVAGRDFHLGYSPERIDPGNNAWRLENTPKVVSGIDAASLDAVKGFYDQIVETTVPVSSPKEAELTKLLENTFRHVNIALVNELAMFANDLGIDVWDGSHPGPASVVTAFRSTRRICRGACVDRSARRSGSSSWRTT
jgi:UDP-N-acetyl-D-glucosamine dehydrogenase